MKYYDFLSTDFNLVKVEKLWYAGKIDGYFTTANILSGSYGLKLSIGINNTEDPKALEFDFLNEYKNIDFSYSSNLITFTFNNKGFKNTFSKTFKEIIDKTIATLRNKQISTGCFKKDINDGTISLVKIKKDETEYLYLCDQAYQEISQEISSEATKDQNTKENIILGILGVIGVSILGIISYVLVGMLNFYVWAVPALLVVGLYSVYYKLAKKISLKSLFIITIFSIVSLYISAVIEYCVRAYKAFDSTVSFMEILNHIYDLFEAVPEFYKSFLTDLAINGFILLVVLGIILYKSYRSEKRFNSIEKINF